MSLHTISVARCNNIMGNISISIHNDFLRHTFCWLKFTDYKSIKKRKRNPTTYFSPIVLACSASILPYFSVYSSPHSPSLCMWFAWDCQSRCPPALVTKWAYEPRQTKETLTPCRLGRKTPAQKPAGADSPLRRYPGDRIFQFLLPGASELSWS